MLPYLYPLSTVGGANFCYAFWDNFALNLALLFKKSCAETAPSNGAVWDY